MTLMQIKNKMQYTDNQIIDFAVKNLNYTISDAKFELAIARGEVRDGDSVAKIQSLQRAKELLIQVQAYKHAPGKHNQLSHGYRLSKTPSLAKARQYRQEGLLQDYLGRARERQGTKPSKVRQGDKPKPEVPQDDEITAKYKVARKEYDAAVDDYLARTKNDIDMLTADKKGEAVRMDWYNAKKRIMQNESELSTAKTFLAGYEKKQKEEPDNPYYPAYIDKYKKKIPELEKKLTRDWKAVVKAELVMNELPDREEVRMAGQRMKSAQVELANRTLSQRSDIMAYHLLQAKSVRENLVSETNDIPDSGDYFQSYYGRASSLGSDPMRNIMSIETNARERLYQDQRGSTNAIIPTGASEQRTRDGVDITMSLIGRNRIMESHTNIFENANVRANHSGDEAAGVIKLAKDDGTDVVVHELGHAIEKADPTIFAESISFLERRTAGEPAKHLGRGYGASEVARFDKFVSPYMGKIYKNNSGEYRASEILSMGLQMFSKNPLKLAKLDPDYFDFIYAVTRLNA